MDFPWIGAVQVVGSAGAAVAIIYCVVSADGLDGDAADGYLLDALIGAGEVRSRRADVSCAPRIAHGTLLHGVALAHDARAFVLQGKVLKRV